MPVHDQGAYVTMLNELEMIEGEVSAAPQHCCPCITSSLLPLYHLITATSGGTAHLLPLYHLITATSGSTAHLLPLHHLNTAASGITA